MSGHASNRLQAPGNRFQNPSDGMFDVFVGQDLLGRVDKRDVEIRAAAGPGENPLLQAIGFLGPAAQEVAFVGPLVELLGHGKEHFRGVGRIGFGIPHIAERKDESAVAALEQTPHGSERTEPLSAG